MTTFVRAGEAARLLGVTTPTLYSYVSRGKIARTLGADGRSSLFDLADIEEMRQRNSRPAPPAPTIDVRIASSVTQLDEHGLRYRGIDVVDLVDEPYERVAELLWSGSLTTPAPAWRPIDSGRADQLLKSDVEHHPTMALIRLASLLEPGPDAPAVARTLLASIPTALGAPSGRTGDTRSFAHRLSQAWLARPSRQLVDAVNTALVLLADHELATSTLAVRVATSVRSSTAAAVIAGLAAVEGELHGSAAHHAHQMFVDSKAIGAEQLLGQMRHTHTRAPGFGHTVYRRQDPRFELLMKRVRALPDRHRRLQHVDDLIERSGSYVTQLPNIDLALGALLYVGGVAPNAPIFAVARIAGWVAHHLEELEERPVRYRGLASGRPHPQSAPQRRSAGTLAE